MADSQQLFTGGRNLALKLPSHEFEDASRFYREVLGLKQLDDYLPSVVFEYGANLLWLDRVETMTQAELWLELRTPDTAAAAKRVDQHRVTRCDAYDTAASCTARSWFEPRWESVDQLASARRP